MISRFKIKDLERAAGVTSGYAMRRACKKKGLIRQYQGVLTARKMIRAAEKKEKNSEGA